MSVVSEANSLKTHCRRGHLLAGDNLYQRHGTRECKACRSLASKRSHARMPDEQAVRKMLEAAHSGLTLKNVCEGRVGRTRTYRNDLFVMHRPQLNTLAATVPALGNRLMRMFRQNEMAARVQGGFSRRKVAAPSIIRATGDIMDAIQAAVPRHLPKDHRDDAIQNIWVDVLQGKFPRTEIAERAPAYVSAEYRTNHNKWGHRSLDVPIWTDSATTLLDTLSTEQGLWR